MNAIELIEQKKARLGKELLTNLEWYLLLGSMANQECREKAAAEFAALKAERDNLRALMYEAIEYCETGDCARCRSFSEVLKAGTE